MGRNDIRVDAIRKATFGKEVREPICKSLEKTLSDATSNIATITQGNDKRISHASVTAIPNETEYVMLVLERANGS